MANKHLIDRIAGIQKMLMAVHAASSPMSASSKGREREQFIDQFLRNALPPIYRFGSGDATDAQGNKSGQLDVVIEYPFVPNLPVGTGQPTRLYLAESVAAVVEVKSNLASQWEEAMATAKAVAPLRREFGATVSMGDPPSHEIPIYVVGYVGWKKRETLRAKLAECPEIAGIMVIEDGMFFARDGSWSVGPEGLWAFICHVFGQISALQSAAVNPWSYLMSPPISGTINTQTPALPDSTFRSSSYILTGGTFKVGEA